MASISLIAGKVEHHLIDPSLDLTPIYHIHGQWGGGHGWLDRRRQLGFFLEKEVKAIDYTGHSLGYWHFKLWMRKCDRPVIALDFRSDVIGMDFRTLRHHIDRTKLFARSQKEYSTGLIRQLGGEDNVLDICLKGIRACGCYPVRTEKENGVDIIKVLVRVAEIDFAITP